MNDTNETAKSGTHENVDNVYSDNKIPKPGGLVDGLFLGARIAGALSLETRIVGLAAGAAVRVADLDRHHPGFQRSSGPCALDVCVDWACQVYGMAGSADRAVVAALAAELQGREDHPEWWPPFAPPGMRRDRAVVDYAPSGFAGLVLPSVRR